MNEKFKTKNVRLLLIAAVLAVGLLKGDAVSPVTPEKRIVILGFDGVDPDLLSRWMADGNLPNLKKLSESGSFRKLRTTNPPDSPVAWSSFATGTNPGKHRVFDFLSRNKETYYPEFAVTKKSEREIFLNFKARLWIAFGLIAIVPIIFFILYKSYFSMKYFFGYAVIVFLIIGVIFFLIPYKLPEIKFNRQGTAFWEYLAESNIKTSLIRMPITFPVKEMKNVTIVPGLGVSDIRGTMGTFSYYATDAPENLDTEMGGKIIKVEGRDGVVNTFVEGPENITSLNPYYVKVPLKIKIDFANSRIHVSCGKQTVNIGVGQWSDWMEFRFPFSPLLSAKGIGKFYLIELEPEFKLYLSPVSFHPAKSLVTLSNPRELSKIISKRIGLYRTMGWSVDTWALKEEKIDEKIFLDDLFSVMNLDEKIALSEYEKQDWRVFVAVFQQTDFVQHMFYRLIDKTHPAYDGELDKKYGDGILRVYKEMDRIVGKFLDNMDGNTVLFVMSDHGFKSFRKGVNINTWLYDNGYLAKNGSMEPRERRLDDLFGHGRFWENVDWTRTKAYSLGLGQIYINLKGRESGGIVPKEEYEKLRSEIITGLQNLKDPETGEMVVVRVYKREEIYKGRYTEESADMQVGFNDGYRVSWQTCLGGVPSGVIEDNNTKWSGDHCSYDPDVVPGILLSNLKNVREDPGIMDIGPTVLDLVGIPVPKEMDGRSVLY